ncbi:hypothetical protein P8452_20164 [Trifolium repens]|nr:hypothetical protein P8452_20164 [Trifolium repens]
MSSENSVQDDLEARGNIDADAPSSLPPKQNSLLSPLISFENSELEERVSRLERVRRELKTARLLLRRNMTEMDFKATTTFL